MTGLDGYLAAEPHHDGSAMYVADPAPTIGTPVTCFVRVPRRGPALQALHARVVIDGEPRFVEASLDREDEVDRWFRVDIPVRNHVTSYRFLLSAPDGTYSWLTGAGRRHHDVTDAEDFRLSAHAPAADWVLDACVYQVFPDRFARSGRVDVPAPPWSVPTGWDEPVVHRGPMTPRQLYGGDLYGVAEHLDHISALGADVVYLTPIFPARSNHRYDATTFERIDPLLGGEEGLRALTREAHARGMRVLGDLTTNHTGDHHEWFVAAQGDDTAPERDFYYFDDADGGYAAWLDVPSLPVLDWSSAGLRHRLTEGPDSVVTAWLRGRDGLDGWRIDVAHMTGRHGTDDRHHEVARLVQAAALRGKPEAWVLAEYFHDPSGQILGDGWHGTMNYPGFLRPVWSWLSQRDPQIDFLGLPTGVPVVPGATALATMRQFHAAVPWRSRVQGVNLLGSHDTPRIRTVIGRDKQLTALALLATMPGAPLVFAGDEIGLEGVDGEDSRTPFPWDDTSTWDQDTLRVYRTWLGLRRRHVALRRGGLRWLHVGDDSMTYVREHPHERILVHVARTEHRPVVFTPGELGLTHGSDLQVLIGDAVRLDAGAVQLPAHGPVAHAYLVP